MAEVEVEEEKRRNLARPLERREGGLCRQGLSEGWGFSLKGDFYIRRKKKAKKEWKEEEEEEVPSELRRSQGLRPEFPAAVPKRRKGLLSDE